MHLSCSELISQQSICCKSQYGDDNWCCCPKVHTPSIQVFPSLQTLQFCSSKEKCKALIQVNIPE